MKHIVMMIVSLLLSFYTAQAQTPIHRQDSIVLSGVWEDFRMVFADKDLSRLKALSTSQIYCSECYDNTEKEKLRNEKLMQANKREST